MITTQYINELTIIIEKLKLPVWGCAIYPANSDIKAIFSDNQVSGFLNNYWKFSESLNTELESVFVTRGEQELQNRYGQLIINKMLADWIPVYEMTTQACGAWQRARGSLQYSTDGELISYTESMLTNHEEEWLGQSRELVFPLSNALHRCLKITALRISEFAPTLYASNKEKFFEFIGDNNTDPTPPDQASQPTEPGAKGPLKTLPPKVMLLEQLGFFKLRAVEELLFESKGKLVSALCGGSADNAVDYIRSCDPERTANGKNPYRNSANIQAVEDLLSQLKKD